MSLPHVEREPSPTRRAMVAAEAPENPFCTTASTRARRAGGAAAWVLDPGHDARVAFARTGRLRRVLDVPSLPASWARADLLAELAAACGRAGVTELRLDTFASSGLRLPDALPRATRRSRTEWVLGLDAEPAAGLGSNHRRNAARGAKAGLRLTRSADPARGRAHAAVGAASVARRRRRGESSEEVGAMESARLLAAGAAELFQAERDGAVLSSLLVLRAPSGAYYHSAGTTPGGMACGASHWLVLEAATCLRAEGLAAFNLGGAGAGQDGLRRFKAGFGAEAVELDSATLRLGSGVWRLGAAVGRYLRRAPRTAASSG